MQTVLLIIVGAIAYRGAAAIGTLLDTHDAVLELPPVWTSPIGKKVVQLYIIVGLPLAFIAGYFLNQSWLEALGVFVGTWVGMLVANIFLRFNPPIQLMVFGTINIAWLIANILRTVGG